MCRIYFCISRICLRNGNRLNSLSGISRVDREFLHTGKLPAQIRSYRIGIRILLQYCHSFCGIGQSGSIGTDIALTDFSGRRVDDIACYGAVFASGLIDIFIGLIFLTGIPVQRSIIFKVNGVLPSARTYQLFASGAGYTLSPLSISNGPV